MKIKFIDTNKKTVELVYQYVRYHKLPVEVHFGNIFDYRGVIVSASNPQFSMGGGLDATIKQNFPKLVKQIKKRKGNQRIGEVIFTITVGDDLKATPELVESAVKFALKHTKNNETLLLSGLGTGIGGLPVHDLCLILNNLLGKSPKRKVARKPKNKSNPVLNGKNLKWKFLRTGLKSENGSCKWKIGVWKKESGISLCNHGFHSSDRIYQAFSYVQGEMLAQVEIDGQTINDSDGTKQVSEKMRVVRAWKWTKMDSVALAIFAAEQVIKTYEDEYPNDDRPRKAIEAAKTYLAKPTKANSDAAADAAARAARAAYAAADAAADAAAYAAAYAAADAAYAAAYAAYAARAADAATYATYAAARQDFIAKIEKWMQERVSQLEEIK